MEAWAPRNKKERTWRIVDAGTEVATEAGAASPELFSRP